MRPSGSGHHGWGGEDRTPRPNLPSAPFLHTAILYRPRLVIRLIIDTNPNYHVLALGGLYGISRTLAALYRRDFTEWGLDPIAVIGISIVVGIPLGILIVTVWSAIADGVARGFGGRGGFEATRAATGWALSPSVYYFPVAAFIYFITGPGGTNLAAMDAAAMTPDDVQRLVVLIAALLGQMIVTVWSLVIFWIAFAEVQRFSLWASLGATVVVCAISLVLAFCIACAIAAGAVAIMMALGIEPPSAV